MVVHSDIHNRDIESAAVVAIDEMCSSLVEFERGSRDSASSAGKVHSQRQRRVNLPGNHYAARVRRQDVHHLLVDGQQEVVLSV